MGRVSKPAMILLLADLLTATALAFQGGFPAFVDVAEQVGVTHRNVSGGRVKDYLVEAIGNGAAFFDYDNDGDIDLLLTNGSTLDGYTVGGDPMAILYRNDGGLFTEVTGEAGLVAHGWAAGVCVADYDNDGDRDFYVTAYGPNVLYRNEGDGTFTEASSEAGVGDPQWSTNCAFGDYDRDGNVDLYVSNYVAFDETTPGRGEGDLCRYIGMPVICGPLGLPGAPDVLFHNNGDGTFSDATVEAGIEDPDYYGFGVIFSDFDNDGWLDIYVANDSVPNLLFHNDQDGSFSEVGLMSGTALGEKGKAQAGMGVDAADYDGDGWMDIFVTNFARDMNTLYRNLGDMFFVDETVTARMGVVSLQHLGWGTGFVDLDNDGLKDIFVANGHIYPEVADVNVGQDYYQRKEIYRNLGDGTFREIAGTLDGGLDEPWSTRGLAFGDFDDDGDIDAVGVNINDRPSLYRNDGGNRHHWLKFRLEGTDSNRDAIGARIRIDIDGTTQIGEVRSGGSYLSHNDMRVHFGLGAATSVDRVRIWWPSGETEDLPPIAGDRLVVVREGEGIVSQEPLEGSGTR